MGQCDGKSSKVETVPLSPVVLLTLLLAKLCAGRKSVFKSYDGGNVAMIQT